MLRLLELLFFVAAAIAAYVILIRPILRRQKALAPFWESLDARESGFLGRLNVRFDGLKTKLAARSVWLSGAVVAAHDFLLPYVLGVDWSPITGMIPPAYIPLILFALGVLFDKLRTISNKPAAV